jgi:hypothetical protein
MRRPLSTRAGAALLTVFVLAGCGIGAQQHADRVPDDRVPFALLDPNAPVLLRLGAPPPNSGPKACFVDGAVVRPVAQAAGQVANLATIVDLLQTPPPNMRTTVADPPLVVSASAAGGIAHIDLRRSISALTAGDQLLAVAQVVCSVTTLPGIGQVIFSVDGAPASVPRGDSSLATGPVSRDDYGNVIAE